MIGSTIVCATISSQAQTGFRQLIAQDRISVHDLGCVDIHVFTGPVLFLNTLVSPDDDDTSQADMHKQLWDEAPALSENIVEESAAFREFILEMASCRGVVVHTSPFSYDTHQPSATSSHTTEAFQTYIQATAGVASKFLPDNLCEAIFHFTGHGGSGGQWVLQGGRHLQLLDISQILEWIKPAKMPCTIVSDCCNSGAVFKEAKLAARSDLRIIAACGAEQLAYCGNLLAFLEHGIIRMTDDGSVQQPCCWQSDFQYASVLGFTESEWLVEQQDKEAASKRGRGRHEREKHVKDPDALEVVRHMKFVLANGQASKLKPHDGDHLRDPEKGQAYYEQHVPRNGHLKGGGVVVVVLWDHLSKRCLGQWVSYTHYGDHRLPNPRYPDRKPKKHKIAFFKLVGKRMSANTLRQADGSLVGASLLFA